LARDPSNRRRYVLAHLGGDAIGGLVTLLGRRGQPNEGYTHRRVAERTGDGAEYIVYVGPDAGLGTQAVRDPATQQLIPLITAAALI
jgi:hypothetical protein